MKTLTAVVLLLTSLLVSGCFEGKNAKCTSACFTLDRAANDDQAAIDQKVKAACESMGRKGKPEILEQTKTSVAGHCAE